MAGQKELPVGEYMCLAFGGKGKNPNETPLSFVITGTLDSLQREEASDLIKKYGGKVAQAVSGKTDYLLAGFDAGESKTRAANEKGITIINEDALFDLIRTTKTLPKFKESQGNPDNFNAFDGKSTSNEHAEIASKASAVAGSFLSSMGIKSPAQKALSATSSIAAASSFGTTALSLSSNSLTNAQPKSASSFSSSSSSSSSSQNNILSSQQQMQPQELLWVDKYKPTAIHEIVGNSGLVEQIKNFLMNWHKQAGHNENAKNAMLISGGPGIGKTTAATLIAQHCNYEVMEFNASDTRSQKSLKEVLVDMVGSRGISEFFGKSQFGAKPNSGGSSSAAASKKKMCIIMDEVDGMSGSDRGGISELIDCIKVTKTPIICICNDASSPKIKSLKNHTINLSWKRPMASQIVARVQEIAKKEGFYMDAPAVEKLANATRSDIRQMLNLLQMWGKSGNRTGLSFDQVREKMETAGKDFEHGPFEVCPAFFNRPTTKDWIEEGINRYFVDADLLPLMVFENYLSTRISPPAFVLNDPRNAVVREKNRGDVILMDLCAEAIDNICEGDIVSSSIREDQDWSMMPLHAVLSSVAPGYNVQGGLGAMLGFPSWLGKNSTTNKNKRNISQIKVVMSLDSPHTTIDFALHVLPVLRYKLMQPLSKHINADSGDIASNVDEVVQILNEYGLTREDWAMINETGEKFSDFNDVKLSDIDGKVKASLTRAMTKEGAMLKVSRPNADKSFKPKRGAGRAVKTEEEEEAEAEGETVDAEEEDDGETAEDAESNVSSGSKSKSSSSKSKSASKSSSTASSTSVKIEKSTAKPSAKASSKAKAANKKNKGKKSKKDYSGSDEADTDDDNFIANSDSDD
jgi:replication factor C subunit 1